MTDFRTYLQNELVSRCRHNSSYSLRAFARSLGVNHGILSGVLNNKRKITPKLVQQLGLALRLEEEQINTFIKTSAQPRTVSKREQLKKLNQLTVDQFNIVSDWYHNAILELSRTTNFDPTPTVIAKRLGLSVTEVTAAIERLQRVGMLEIDDNGKWLEPLGDHSSIQSNDFSNRALRNLQKQYLCKSLEALESIDRADRDHTGITMAINSKDLPEAKLRIQKFRRELMAFLQRNQVQPDEVYQLAVSIFPLTKLTRGVSNGSE